MCGNTLVKLHVPPVHLEYQATGLAESHAAVTQPHRASGTAWVDRISSGRLSLWNLRTGVVSSQCCNQVRRSYSYHARLCSRSHAWWESKICTRHICTKGVYCIGLATVAIDPSSLAVLMLQWSWPYHVVAKSSI